MSGLLVRVDRPFILRTDTFTISPLPVVAIIIDFLDRDRGLRRNVIRKIVWSLFDLLLFCRLLETGLSILVLGERLSVLATSRSCSGSDSLSVLTISVGRSAGGVGGS
jgi:hypothetical protein